MPHNIAEIQKAYNILDYAEAKTTWLKAYELTDGKTEWHKERVEKFSYESTVDGLNIYSFQTMNVEG